MLKEAYSFEISEGEYLEIKTDFETIEINTGSPHKFLTERHNLIRFISEEFEDEYQSDDPLHAVYFLPSHKEKEFIKLLYKLN